MPSTYNSKGVTPLSMRWRKLDESLGLEKKLSCEIVALNLVNQAKGVRLRP